MGNSPVGGSHRRSSAFEDPLTRIAKEAKESIASGETTSTNVEEILNKPSHRRSLTLPTYVRTRPNSFAEPKRRLSVKFSMRKADTISTTSSTTGADINDTLADNHSVIGDNQSIIGDTLSLPSDSPPSSPFSKGNNNNNIPELPSLPPLNIGLSMNDEMMPPPLTTSRQTSRDYGNQLPPLAPLKVNNIMMTNDNTSSSNNDNNNTNNTMNRPSLLKGLSQVQLRATEKLNIDVSDDTFRQSQKSSLCSTDCTEIKPYLYLAGDLVAKNKEQLLSNGITHIFNVAHSVCPNYHITEKLFEYISFELVDNAAETISHFMLRAIVEIERVRNLNGTILVHCHQGVSRSATLVIAYLMWLEKIGYEDAFRYVKHRRSICSPNVGFMVQLKDWEKRLQMKLTKPTLHHISPHSDRDKTLVLKPLWASYESLSPSGLAEQKATRRKSTSSRAVVFSTILQNNEAYILHVPDLKTIYIWVGHLCPELTTYHNAAKTFANWMNDFEPAFSGCTIVEVISRNSTEVAENDLIESSFWLALNQVDFMPP